MSYARFGTDGSDVYVFGASNGLECCGCLLGRDTAPWTYYGGLTTDEMIAHLQLHRDAGHTVPTDLVPLLEWARADNDRDALAARGGRQ
jgi:hypothetical protein